MSQEIEYESADSKPSMQINNDTNENEPSSKKRGRLSQWLSRIFIFVGAVWIIWLLIQDGETIVQQFTSDSVYWFVIALTLGTISIFHNGPIFHLMVNAHTQHPQPIGYTFSLVFIGQMIRHVPGRFWGMVYQVNESRDRVPATVMVKINIDFTLIFLAMNLIVPFFILLFYQLNIYLAFSFLLITVICLALGFRFNWICKILFGSQRWMPKRIFRRIEAYIPDDSGHYSWKRIFGIILFLLSAWFFYLVAWQSLKGIYPAFADTNMFLLCASYSIAWVVGFLSMVTPAGLGIREAVFVFFSASFVSAGDTAILAVFIRIWLLLVDFILFGFAWITKLIISRSLHV